MKVHWLREALVSLREACEYVALDDPRAAIRVRAKVRIAVEHLARFPNSGRPGLIDGTRELVVIGLPYIVVYRVAREAIEILRIHHASTNWAEKGLV